MLTGLRQIHRFYTLGVILLLFFLFYPWYYFLSRKPGRYLWLNRFRKLNSLLCSWLTGIIFRFHFERPLEETKTYIYCANHTSNLDIMILCILGVGRFHFMGKQELLHNPVLKIFFQSIDVPVNRDSKISAFRAFKKVGENLEAGMSLIIFPEGKIDDHYPPQLVPFKNGPFRLAIEKNIPIVPVSIINAWKKMWDDGARYGTSPGICDIFVHAPMSTKELNISDSDLLKERVFELINNKISSDEY